MKLISLNNGTTFDRVENLTPEQREKVTTHWQALCEAMDNETRERVHNELAPCSELEFLSRYLEIAPDHLVLG